MDTLLDHCGRLKLVRKRRKTSEYPLCHVRTASVVIKVFLMSQRILVVFEIQTPQIVESAI